MYSPSAFDRNARPQPGSYQDLGWLDSFLSMGAQDPLQSEIDASARLRERMKKKEAMEAWMNSPAGQQLAHEELLRSLENPPMSPIESQVQADEDYFNSPAFEERLDELQAESTADIERRVAEAMTPMGRLNRGSTINPMEAEMLLNEEVNAKYNRLHGDRMLFDAEMIQNNPYLQRNMDPTGRSYPVSWAYPGADIDARRDAKRINADNQRVIDEQNAIRSEEIMTDLFGSKDQRDRDRQLAERTPSWEREGFESRDAWIEDRKAKQAARKQKAAETRSRQDEIRRANDEKRAREKAQRNAPPATVTTSSGTTTHGPSGQPVNTGTGNATPEGEGQKKTSSGRKYKRKPLDEILNPIGQFDDAPWLTKNRNQTANQYLYG